MGYNIITLKNTDSSFYNIMGRYLAKKEIIKELGGPVYDEDNKMWFVAMENDKVLGFIAIVEKETYAEVDSTYVMPPHRGRGIFKRLFKEAFEHASSNYSRINAFVFDNCLKTYGEYKFKEITKYKIGTKMQWQKGE